MVNKVTYIDSIFWKNKKVFITGHTGFKGSWLTTWMKMLGANVKGYSLSPNTNPNLYDISNAHKSISSEFADIRDIKSFESSFHKFKPEIVFHLAAQPLVRYSYDHPRETYEVNLMGTLNLLDIIKKTDYVKSVVLVTTDKCYENKEWTYGYREIDPMGGFDPYSSSKGCCELLISSYRRSFFNKKNSPNIASVRAGNVIGGGDWSADRLIPDIINSIIKNKQIILRNPNSTRPWQHVLEPLSGYILLAQKLFNNSDYAEAWNFGPHADDCKSVSWITEKIINLWGYDQFWTSDKLKHPHEANYLKLDISKAMNKLSWYPKLKLEKALDMLIKWHKSYLKNENMEEVMKNQINEYLYGNK